MSQTDLQKKAPLEGITLEHISVKGYEKVIKATDLKNSLHAFIAIHNTSLGMALGGIRIYPYQDEKQALEDVLRLSRGMSHKAAIAGVGFGGGKSVIMADPRTQKTPELLRAFGRVVNSLEGQYICAEDVGCTVEDVKIVREETQYVVGLPHAKSSGDPSKATALGTYRGIQSVMKWKNGSDSLVGKTVALQGLGSVGSKLVHLLHLAGAKLIVTDVDEKRLKDFRDHFPDGKIVSTEQIYSQECDIFAPCAMGASLNDQTIGQLRCVAIAGCANNQLHRPYHGDLLKKRGILYAPDFVINSGGLINVWAELEKEGYNTQAPTAKIMKIYDSLLSIYTLAQNKDISTAEAALSLAEYRIQYGIGKRTVPPYFHH